jgi:hypothetical protein
MDYIIPADAAPTVRRRLAETIAWCSNRTTGAVPRQILRSPELEPDHLFVIERPSPDGTDTLDYFGTEERANIVQRLADKRASLLTEQGIEVPELTPDLMGGRLLLFEIDWSVWDGLSENESQSYFDVYDNPAWDTWVHLQPTERGDTLLCWVPPLFIPFVNGGIAVNCTSCIDWVDRLLEGQNHVPMSDS